MSKEKKTSDQPAPFRGEFSFVNKDAGNIDSKEHNAAVSWHVMNRYERWKKQEQAKKLRASVNVPVKPLSELAPTSQASQQLQQQQQQQQAGPSTSRSPVQQPNPSTLSSISPIPGTAPFGFDPWTIDPLQLGYPDMSSGTQSSAGFPQSTTSTPSTRSSLVNDEPSTLLGTLRDPRALSETLFDDSLRPVIPLVNHLIGFAYEFFIPQQWPKESEKPNRAFEIARSYDDASLMYQDSCYAYGYLSLLATALATVTDDEELMFQSKSFQGRAMTELRARVARQGKQDLTTLKAILKLFSSETLVDNTSTARRHLKMLRNLVNGTGGVILLDSWFREDLLSSDTYFALKYETRPLFPAQEWTPGPLSQPWKARLLAAGILGDHNMAVDSLIDHPVLKAVMIDLRELLKSDEYLRTHDISAEDQLLRWQQLRKLDCLSRLADHFVNLAIYPHLFSRPLTQACACIATALFANMALGSPEPVRFGRKLICDLRKKMIQSESEGEQEQHRRLRLWALYVGSLAEKIHPMDESHAGWFGRSYHTQAAEMQLSTWEDTSKILKQFLYSEALHQEVRSGRSYRTTDVRQGYYAASACSWREPIVDINELADLGAEIESSSILSGKQRAVVE